MSLSKCPRDDSFAKKALDAYLSSLQKKPVLTKSLTSAVVAAFGNILAQIIAMQRAEKQTSWNWRSTIAISIFGLIFNGPLSHHFYKIMDEILPKSSGKSFAIKRVLFDRLIFAPPYLLFFFYIIAILEGKNSREALMKIKENYWTTLKMNWKIWTGFQFINVNYIPSQYRVLFANMVSLVWTVYISTARQK